MADEPNEPGAPAAPPAGGDGAPDLSQYSETVQNLMKDPAGIQKLLDRKSEVNDREKSTREKLDLTEKELNDLKAQRAKELEDAENAKLSAQERLEKQLGQYQTQIQEYQGKTGSLEQQIFSLKVQNAALKEGAKDPKYVDFRLGQHLATLEPDSRAKFGEAEMTAWLADFKKENLENHFSSGPKPPAQTRPGPPGDPPPEERGGKKPLKSNVANPTTFDDLKALNEEIKATIRGN